LKNTIFLIFLNAAFIKRTVSYGGQPCSCGVYEVIRTLSYTYNKNRQREAEEESSGGGSEWQRRMAFHGSIKAQLGLGCTGEQGVTTASKAMG
jgi:hypothetical protein